MNNLKDGRNHSTKLNLSSWGLDPLFRGFWGLEFITLLTIAISCHSETGCWSTSPKCKRTGKCNLFLLTNLLSTSMLKSGAKLNLYSSGLLFCFAIRFGQIDFECLLSKLVNSKSNFYLHLSKITLIPLQLKGLASYRHKSLPFLLILFWENKWKFWISSTMFFHQC